MIDRQEWLERYKLALWCDIESFKHNWRTVVVEKLIALAGNVFFGFGVGLLVSLVSLQMWLVEVADVLRLACTK